MSQLANENAAWVLAKLEERGLLTDTMERAAYIASALIPSRTTWFDHYARAYSDGHNNRGLRGRRLDHFANAFADICEEVAWAAPELEMTLEAFWLQWDQGELFEGTCGEHWYLADPQRE